MLENDIIRFCVQGVILLPRVAVNMLEGGQPGSVEECEETPE